MNKYTNSIGQQQAKHRYTKEKLCSKNKLKYRTIIKQIFFVTYCWNQQI